MIDVTLIVRVISNLVENAIKYSGEGSSIKIVSTDDEKWVYVKIEDNGAGIKKEDLEHIFDKFYRVKNDANHAIKGSGLGLYLVKYFVELHGGNIEVESEVGKGTTFSIKLPNE
jgi:signal transduction histidine kinase